MERFNGHRGDRYIGACGGVTCDIQSSGSHERYYKGMSVDLEV